MINSKWFSSLYFPATLFASRTRLDQIFSILCRQPYIDDKRCFRGRSNGEVDVSHQIIPRPALGGEDTAGSTVNGFDSYDAALGKMPTVLVCGWRAWQQVKGNANARKIFIFASLKCDARSSGFRMRCEGQQQIHHVGSV